jgi:excisionase family DNA binding protein
MIEHVGSACTGGEAGALPAWKGGCRMAGEAERLGELRFLTVAEVASVMRVSKMTVYRLVNAGTLPAVRVGRSVRVPEQAVHDYLQHSFVEAG